MKIMSVNAGSSSFKFSLFEMEREEVLISGVFERIGIEGGSYTLKYQGEKITQEVVLPNHLEAVRILIEKLIQVGVISSLDEIQGIGHRIVNGGEKYKESTLIDDEVLQEVLRIKDLAPLHNPVEVEVITAFQKELPNVPMVAVFDTSFHQTMEEEKYLYPVPYKWYQKYGVRKYGAHGTSHRYITEKISKELNNDHLRIISCHIGNGASICAIKDKKCIDTSMGFTPLAGVMMGTRSGDIDPSIIPYIMEKEDTDINEVMRMLNKESGLLGMSGKSNDTRDLIALANEGDKASNLALEKYVSCLVNYIGQYYVTLGGVDVICFTAGVGENSFYIREKIMERLAVLGIVCDLDKNRNTIATFAKISSPTSKIDVYVVPTDEELMIARDTVALI